MKVVYFTHSLLSCWNHGNAHFLRGVLSELDRRGHQVEAFEPAGNWSLANLLQDGGEDGLTPFRGAYPNLHATDYAADAEVGILCDGADVVIVHEWNAPALVARIGALRRSGGPFTLLFHDTHHRAVSEPDAIRAFDLNGYDGILAFGDTLAAVYRQWGWGHQVFVWHEAADTHVFHPPTHEQPGERAGLVWIGNWGDGERSAELESFLFRPARMVDLPLDIYGVRYPDVARAMLQRYGVRYRGWLPNAAAPGIFARHLATVHVPRRFYVQTLPGIPTIRVFEALACGIPLVSAPWSDSEHLFTIGKDFLLARSEAEMTAHLQALRRDPELRAAIAQHGLDTIRARHSCKHRVDDLMQIVAHLRAPKPAGAAAAVLETAHQA